MFSNYVILLAEGFDRLEVVFNRYFKKGLKAQTRKGQSSSGTRMLQITDDVAFPRNFLTSFLCNTDDKHDLELYLVSNDNSMISFPPTVNETVFQITSTD